MGAHHGYNDRVRSTHDVAVTFTNHSEEGRYEISTNQVSYTFSEGSLSGETELTYAGNDSEVYIAPAADEHAVPESYLYLPSLVSQTTTIDLATLTPMTTSQLDISAFDAVRYDVNAISGDDIHYLVYSQYQSGSLRYSYPGDAFPNFVETDMKKGDLRYRNLTEKAISLKTSNSTIDISYDDTSFTGMITGDADYCTYRIDGPEQYWITYTRPGIQRIIIPEIPALPGFSLDMSTSEIEVSAVDATNFNEYGALPQFFANYPGDAVLYDVIWILAGHQTYQTLADPFARQPAETGRSPKQRARHLFPWDTHK